MLPSPQEDPVPGRTNFSEVAKPPDVATRARSAQRVALEEGWLALYEGGADDLANLRTRGGKNQVAVAAALGVAQSEISRIENQDDVKLSTLRAYIGALGGQLHIVAEIDGELLPIHIGPS
jgi:hypothetical protein